MATCTATVTGRHRDASARSRCPACGATSERRRAQQDETAPLPRLARLDAAGSAETSPEQLTALANSDSATVRARVAENPACPGDVLEFLAQDESADVRVSVARNHHTPSAALERMALLSRDSTTSAVAATNPSLSRESIEMLSSIAGLRPWLAKNSSTPPALLLEIVREITSSGDPLATMDVAANPSVPDEAVGLLARGSDIFVASAQLEQSRRIRDRFGVHPDNTEATEALAGQDWWALDRDSDDALLVLTLYPNP